MEAEKTVTLADFQYYVGDVNLEYGGVFYNLDNTEYGYADFLEVIDLDSAAGVDDCVLVQRGTVILDDEKVNARALQCCGWTSADLPTEEPQRTLQLADAVRSYGHYDTDDGANVLIWMPFDDDDPPPDAENWRADLVKLADGQDLFDYLLESGYLSDFS